MGPCRRWQHLHVREISQDYLLFEKTSFAIPKMVVRILGILGAEQGEKTCLKTPGWSRRLRESGFFGQCN